MLPKAEDPRNKTFLQKHGNTILGLVGAAIVLWPVIPFATIGAAIVTAGKFIFSAIFSDERLKTDIVEVGEVQGAKYNLPLYSWRYIWQDEGEERNLGYMAKDVEKFIPEAVGEEAGYQTLDYAMVADFINAGGLDG